MKPQRPGIIPDVIALDPHLKIGKHSILLFLRLVFIGLPRSSQVVRQADDNSRIEKDQFRAGGQCPLDQFSVASFDHPSLMLGQEPVQTAANRGELTHHRALAGQPDDAVQIEMCQPLFFYQPTGQGRFA